MQSASSRIWTRVAVSISYNDNHYTTVTSINRAITVIFRLITKGKVQTHLPPAMGYIVPLPFFYKDCFVIK